MRHVFAMLMAMRPPATEHPPALAPHRVQKTEVLAQLHVVMVLRIVLPHVVRRRRDNELHRPIVHLVHRSAIRTIDSIEFHDPAPRQYLPIIT